MARDPKENAFATVRIYMDAMAANLDRTILEDAGIPAFVRGEMGATWMGLGSLAPGGIRLDVPQDRIGEARTLLNIPPEEKLRSGV
ncbi:MAG: putative signal transducing protein [Opitutales bacterium]